MPATSSGANAYNPPPAQEVFRLSDNANASIAPDVRRQFHCDDNGNVLFFTAPPQDAPRLPKSSRLLGHSLRYRLEKLRAEKAARDAQARNTSLGEDTVTHTSETTATHGVAVGTSKTATVEDDARDTSKSATAQAKVAKMAEIRSAFLRDGVTKVVNGVPVAHFKFKGTSETVAAQEGPPGTSNTATSVNEPSGTSQVAPAHDNGTDMLESTGTKRKRRLSDIESLIQHERPEDRDAALKAWLLAEQIEEGTHWLYKQWYGDEWKEMMDQVSARMEKAQKEEREKNEKMEKSRLEREKRREIKIERNWIYKGF